MPPRRTEESIHREVARWLAQPPHPRNAPPSMRPAVPLVRSPRVTTAQLQTVMNAVRNENRRRAAAATRVQAAWRGMVGRQQAKVKKTRAAHKLVGNTIRALPPMGRRPNGSYAFPGGSEYHNARLKWTTAKKQA